MTGDASMIAIIVPTVNRPHLLEGLLESIHGSTVSPHAVHLMVEWTDDATRATLQEPPFRVGAFEHLGDYGSYTAAANAGVARTREPYFLVANDDVIFHPGWDEDALSAMEDPVRVVGIDQGNGRHDCFFLVDRRYLSEQGGTPEGPGEFFHPGYVSQFVDTEFVELACARGVWADAPGALIEHRHWTLGKSQVDVNYEKAIVSGAPDRALFESRRSLWQA